MPKIVIDISDDTYAYCKEMRDNRYNTKTLRDRFIVAVGYGTPLEDIKLPVNSKRYDSDLIPLFCDENIDCCDDF